MLQSQVKEYSKIDDNFLEKNLCHSRDSNHRSPVFRTGALTTYATVTSDTKIFNINVKYKPKTR